MLHSYTPRFSKDSYINKAGVCLAQLCLRFNLSVLNGTPPYDFPGEFTFASKRGCSVIDYFLISSAFWDQVKSFLIGHRVDSDHFPLLLVIKLPRYAEISDHLSTMPPLVNDRLPKVRWSEDLACKVAGVLNKVDLDTFFPIFGDINQTADGIKNYDNFVLQLSEVFRLHEVPHPRPKIRGNCGWFDKECCQLKSDIRRIYHQYRVSGQDTLPLEFFQMKSQLRHLCNLKREKFNQKSWEPLIQATLNNDSRKFWAIISDSSSSKYLSNSLISPNAWLDYFSGVFREHSSISVVNSDLDLADCPEWPPVHPEEVELLIK